MTTAANGVGRKRIGLFLAPLLALALGIFGNLDPAHPETTRMAAIAVLMAGWWVTEAIPIPATALLPVALFPLLGILPAGKTSGAYFNDTIFLFIGGFLFALAMERWDLHRRIALRIILWIGTGPRRLLLGFMIATWFLSMWISNTATTMMMVPMATALLFQLREAVGPRGVGRYPVGLLLGIAYGASIGGLATLIGTPPNLAFVQIFHVTFKNAPADLITFTSWLGFALPLSVVFLALTWLLLGKLFPPPERRLVGDTSVFREAWKKLGPMSREERTILILFGVLVFLWMFRVPLDIGGTKIGWTLLLPGAKSIGDGTVAILVASLLFLIPARGGRERLMNWETATRLNWGIVLLFGGGFALALGFRDAGLSSWLAVQLRALSAAPPLLLVVATCTLMTFLTELTSNTATTQMALPVLASLALAIGANPLLLMIPATLSASCAFMLPVATPPNAIVFASDEIQMGDMVKGGFLLNLIGIVLVTATVYLLGPVLLGVDFTSVPAWAR